MGPIIVTGQEVATIVDVLQGTRLQTAPADGLFTFQFQASDNVAANNFTVSLQLPDGSTPLNAVQVPAGESAGLAGQLDDRRALIFSAIVLTGGHCVLGFIETGDTEVTWRVTFSPYG